MSPLTDRARNYYRRYLTEESVWVARARLAREYVDEVLSEMPVELHMVAGRAKHPASLLQKIRRKNYGDPARQLFDRIGIRVITYYEGDVDRVVGALKTAFTINDRHSEDKRTALALREFGYRSVHLIVQIPDTPLVPGRYTDLRRLWFEIQVRSILEHAWAEIEHHVEYKAGTHLPEPIRRRLSAIAGALEVLEHEFSEMREERDRLVTSNRTALETGDRWDSRLDSALLIACLELIHPEGLGWRAAAGAGVLPVGTEVAATDLLASVGVNTPAQLEAAIDRADVRRVVRDVSAARGTAPLLLSHLALVVALASALDSETVRLEYPDLVEQSGLVELSE